MAKTVTELKTQASRVGAQPALYVNIVELDLDKTSLAGKQVAISFYFLLLILHGLSTRQKKLSAAITTKEKPTPDVRDDANKSRRNTQNTYTTLPLYTLHTFLVCVCVCVWPGQSESKWRRSNMRPDSNVVSFPK